MACLERIEAVLESRTPVPSHATPGQEPASPTPQMSFSPDHARQDATVQHQEERLDPFCRPSSRALPVALRCLAGKGLLPHNR